MRGSEMIRRLGTKAQAEHEHTRNTATTRTEVVVLPTCCLVAATKMGLGRLVVNSRRADEAVAALRAVARVAPAKDNNMVYCITLATAWGWRML